MREGGRISNRWQSSNSLRIWSNEITTIQPLYEVDGSPKVDGTVSDLGYELVGKGVVLLKKVTSPQTKCQLYRQLSNQECQEVQLPPFTFIFLN